MDKKMTDQDIDMILARSKPDIETPEGLAERIIARAEGMPQENAHSNTVFFLIKKQKAVFYTAVCLILFAGILGVYGLGGLTENAYAPPQDAAYATSGDAGYYVDYLALVYGDEAV